jgi:hypothetical protein
MIASNNENISLPDISSTEIAPNKLSAPNKIININHVRGLQAYQKQLGKNGSNVEELGGHSNNGGITERVTSSYFNGT